MDELPDWNPPKHHGGYPEEYADFGCTASECGRVEEMSKEIREAGVDQIGGARRRRRRRHSRRQRQQQAQKTRRRRRQRHHH